VLITKVNYFFHHFIDILTNEKSGGSVFSLLSCQPLIVMLFAHAKKK